ncbi:MAG: MFS transporter [Alphaproteobacteria bacterium]|nr:MFS transporter [Alphaproteobacteria bacterium]
MGVWLKSYGLDYTTIGLFGLLHLPYALKPLWAPLLDHVPLPFFTKALGQRRSWLCLAQLTAIAGLLGMISSDPVENLYAFVSCGLLVTFSAASQHILLLAYQMETLRSRDWGVGEGMSVFGYRMGILTSGPVALSLATYFSWQEVYSLLAFLMVVGLIPVLMGDNLEHISAPSLAKNRGWFRYAVVAPFKDFTRQKGWIAILVFMLLYRLPHSLLSMMQTLFLLDLGFTKIEISLIAKTFGMGTVIVGGFIGGYWIRRYGYKRTLLWGAMAHGIACLLFLVQARLGANLPFLYVTIGAEHFCGGLMLTAFLSYQLTCANVAFAATQLALLTAFTNLGSVFAKPISGVVIDTFGWVPFLMLVFLSAIPGILWVYRIPFPQQEGRQL